jgi:hypothetical protein
MNTNISKKNNTPLFTQIQTLITNARSRVATVVNQELVTLYWAIGQHIRQDILNANRAEYGKQIIVTLSTQLTLEYGKGWSEKQLRHCMRLSEAFPDQKILSAVQRELSWTHIKMIMSIDDELKRSFYIELCKLRNLRSRLLRKSSSFCGGIITTQKEVKLAYG